jgi:hypothetical protein
MLGSLIFFNEESLRRTLRHISPITIAPGFIFRLDKDSPESRSIQSVGRIIVSPEVSGRHHRYDRAA